MATAKSKTTSRRKTKSTSARSATKKTTSARKRSTAKDTAAGAAAPEPKYRGRLISVYGPFDCMSLIEVSTETAHAFFRELGGPQLPDGVIRAVERDLEQIKEHAPDLAEALQATAMQLARELDHPGNSATSKSMCAARLNETMDKLRAAIPPKVKRDGIDELAEAREQRRARAQGASS